MDKFYYYDYYHAYENVNKSEFINGDYQVKVGVAVIEKNDKNQIGVSIGGGAPHCPCIYVVSLTMDGPAHQEQTLEPGDLIISVDGLSVSGKSKQEVAAIIQSSQGSTKIQYSKLEFTLKDIGQADIFLTKIKQWFVEKVSEETADMLGLSRAVLSKDGLQDKIKSVNKGSALIVGLIGYMGMLRTAFSNLASDYNELSQNMQTSSTYKYFRNIKSGYDAASEIFSSLEDQCVSLVESLTEQIQSYKSLCKNTKCDIKRSMKRYLEKKVVYLSYCLRVREFEDEMNQASFFTDYAYRMETGNLDYRVALRCRFLAKKEFVQLREFIMIKMEFLDQKYVESSIKLLHWISMLKANFYKKHSEIIPFDYALKYRILPDPEILSD